MGLITWPERDRASGRGQGTRRQMDASCVRLAGAGARQAKDGQGLGHKDRGAERALQQKPSTDTGHLAASDSESHSR